MSGRSTSRNAARKVRPGQTHFALSQEAWREFSKALDAPPRDIPALRRLLLAPSVFTDHRKRAIKKP